MSKKPVPMDALVGSNIRTCRVQRGLTQGELGRRIGVTFQQVQKYENGDNRVGASRLTLIADALGVPLATLFEGSQVADCRGPDLSGRALLAKPHAIRLAQAFDRISRGPMRLAVVRLVEALAEQRSDRGPSGRSNRRIR